MEKPEVVFHPHVSQYGVLIRIDPEKLIMYSENVTLQALREIHEAWNWSNTLSRRIHKASSTIDLTR